MLSVELRNTGVVSSQCKHFCCNSANSNLSSSWGQTHWESKSYGEWADLWSFRSLTQPFFLPDTQTDFHTFHTDKYNLPFENAIHGMMMSRLLRSGLVKQDFALHLPLKVLWQSPVQLSQVHKCQQIGPKITNLSKLSMHEGNIWLKTLAKFKICVSCNCDTKINLIWAEKCNIRVIIGNKQQSQILSSRDV